MAGMALRSNFFFRCVCGIYFTNKKKPGKYQFTDRKQEREDIKMSKCFL